MFDSRIHMLADTLAHRPAAAEIRSPETREAAVALLLRPREELELLLIKRAEYERDPWSGHMALPGGRREPDDPDLLATAIRETHEETGIDLKVATPLGQLDEVAPRSPRLPPILISPFVFAVPESTEALQLSREVDAAIWIPTSALRAPGAVSELLIQFEGGDRAFPSLRYGEYVIWGLTHRILLTFFDVLDSIGA